MISASLFDKILVDIETLYTDAWQFSIADGSISGAVTRDQYIQITQTRFMNEVYPSVFPGLIEIDSAVDPETGMQYCSADFFL